MKGLSVAVVVLFLFCSITARPLADSLIELLPQSRDTTKVNHLNEIVWELCCTNNHEAFAYAHQSISLASELNYWRGLADAYNYLGVVYQNTGKYDSAIYYLEKAYDLNVELENENKAAGCLNNIGVTLLYQSNYDEALSHFYRALSTKEKLNDKQSLISIYNNIGIVLANLKNNDKALEYYLKSIEVSEGDGTTITTANTYNNIGVIYHNRMDYDDALYYYGKSLETFHKLSNNKGIAANYQNMALIYLEQEKFDEARAAFNHALEILEKLDDRQAMIISYLGLANVCFYRKQYYNSIDLFKLAYNKAQEIGAGNNGITALKGIADSYEELGNFQQALHYHKQYKNLVDSLFSVESNRNISELQEKYEAEKRDQEIMQLNFETELKEVEIKNQRFWLIVSISGLLVFIVLSVVMLIQRNQKNKAFKDLVRKNLENVEFERKFRKNQTQETPIPETDNSEASLKPESEKYRNSNLEDHQKQKLLDKLINAMEIRKMFLDTEMNVDKLAQELNTNKRYLSQVINELKNQNFSTFLNDYRIREARLLLLDPKNQHLTIETIAGMVGFNSKSAFNNAFKKFTGVTPSFFVNNSRSFR
jgi:tetratricopeptide (TPR) repeat protein